MARDKYPMVKPELYSSEYTWRSMKNLMKTMDKLQGLVTVQKIPMSLDSDVKRISSMLEKVNGLEKIPPCYARPPADCKILRDNMMEEPFETFPIGLDPWDINAVDNVPCAYLIYVSPDGRKALYYVANYIYVGYLEMERKKGKTKKRSEVGTLNRATKACKSAMTAGQKALHEATLKNLKGSRDLNRGYKCTASNFQRRFDQDPKIMSEVHDASFRRDRKDKQLIGWDDSSSYGGRAVEPWCGDRDGYGGRWPMNNHGGAYSRGRNDRRYEHESYYQHRLSAPPTPLIYVKGSVTGSNNVFNINYTAPSYFENSSGASTYQTPGGGSVRYIKRPGFFLPPLPDFSSDSESESDNDNDDDERYFSGSESSGNSSDAGEESI